MHDGDNYTIKINNVDVTASTSRGIHFAILDSDFNLEEQ